MSYTREVSLVRTYNVVLNEVDYVMREIHERACRNHARARSLVHKLIWARYYWPTMQKDIESYLKACNNCQRFSNIIR